MTRSLTPKIRLFLLLALLLGVGSAYAQTSPLGLFGNEWIQANQPYYKIKVSQRGIHRLSSTWLAAAGVPTATLDPHRLQLWRRGQEQAIYVAGEADSRLDAADYIDFWGQPNDGLMESEMFKNPAEQVSQLAPLYADTAAYFLTVVPAGTPTRRMAALTTTPTATPVAHHFVELEQGIAEFYEKGREYDAQAETALPWLDKTEGYFSRPFGYGGPASLGRAVALTLPSAPDSTNPALVPHLQVMVASISYLPLPMTVVILRGTGSTATVVRTIGPLPAPPAYGHVLLEVPLRFADFDPAGVLSFRVEPATPPPGTASAVVLAFTRLVAPVPNVLAGQRRLIITDSTLSAASQYLRFDTPPATTVGYDVTNPNAPIRISGQAAGAQWGLTVPTPGPGARRVFLADDAAPLVAPAGRSVALRILTPQPGAFLLVTSRRLLTDTTGIHPVRDYANYRASVPGGGHDTVVMVMEQLYDVFHYGDPSPNAVRRFALFMSSGSAPAGYLFLLGKGYEPLPRQGNGGTVAQNRAQFYGSFVPVFGYPGSDVVTTADYRNSQPSERYYPRVSTGRVAAVKASEVAVYLAKVQAHESAPVADWRKEVLHLGGGRGTVEQGQFSGYLNGYKTRVEDQPYFGGHVTSILRGNSGQTVSSVNVSTQVNRGLSLITFFGHSSTLVSDIDIGRPSDPLANYRNVGRYPMIVMNGCLSGNVYTGGLSFGEDWMLTTPHGAIAFMAYNSRGFPHYLNAYTNEFYAAAFNDSLSYGRGIGDVQRRTIQRATPNLLLYSQNGEAQLLGVVLQTDPAVRLYSPDKPDYFIADTTVSLRPMPGERLTARASGVQVMVRLHNYAKATNDSVRVRVRRTFQSGIPAQVVNMGLQRVYYGDSILFTLPNPPSAGAQGVNTFDIFVDWPDSVQEMNETNNQASITYAFPSGSVFPLFPQEFAIVPTTTPNLVGEYDQPVAQNRDYTFELDTVPTFSSPIRAQTLINAGRYPVWRPTLPATPADSVVWFWRFRPQTIQPGEDSTWATSSFRYIAASPGGWSQSHYGQFARDKKFSLSQAAPTGQWNYSPTLLRLLLRTNSGDSTRYQVNTSSPGRTFITPPNGIFFNASSRMRAIAQASYSNIFLMVFNPRTLEPITGRDRLNSNGLVLADSTSWYGQENNPGEYTMFSATGDTIPGGTSQRQIVSIGGTLMNPIIHATARVDSMAQILSRVPDGYIVALVTANRVPFDEIRAQRPELLNQLRTIGSALADSLHSGDPFVIVGTKGSAPGTASEKTWDRSLARRWGQTIILDTIRQANEPRGQVLSTVIGPVQQWRDVIQTVKQVSTTSTYNLTVVPIDTANQDGTPIPVTIPASPLNSTSSFSLANINAAQFPKARLELSSADTVNRLAPQLEQWLVTYVGVPEGIVRTDLLRSWQLNLTPQVDSGLTRVRLKVPFQNISTVQFRDSVTAEFSLLYAGNRALVTGTTPMRIKLAKLKPDSIGWAVASLPIPRVSNSYLLRVVFNPGPLQPEQYDFNNAFEAPFQVVNPNLAPLVDVAFDGQHILHGDIVAPAPIITITVRDEDKNVPLDPNHVVLVLTRPGQTVGQQISVTSPQVRIQPATATKPLMITYEPGRLDDGVYKLDVQATDPAGNIAGTEPFKSEFRVINETMISNFYPYPNPFSTSTRFLFTITGKVPQNLKIQIMTVTGRVVREITKEELGTDLRVGHNTSTSTWNGTDEYGDALANGVYLYRVVVQDDADNFKSFKTAGDSKAFHKTWGKLYILR